MTATTYTRIEDGTTTVIPAREALAEINHAMMDGKHEVREMSAARGEARIVYKDGRTVKLNKQRAEAKNPASRSTYYRHADGTVSTRNSRTRVYAWAVEEIRDLHAEATDMEAAAEKYAAELESYERAVKNNRLRRAAKPWPRGARYIDYYVDDPETGVEHWLDAEVEKDGKIERPVNVKEAVVKRRADYQSHVTRARQQAQELAGGPRHAYCIVRWSERREAADKALGSFRNPHATYRVVEAREGKSANSR